MRTTSKEVFSAARIFAAAATGGHWMTAAGAAALTPQRFFERLYELRSLPEGKRVELLKDLFEFGLELDRLRVFFGHL